MKLVYLVDDNQDVLEELYGQLSMRYDIIATINPNNALRKAINEKLIPSLLVTGLLRNSAMTGSELIGKFHEIDPRIKFVLYSDHPENELREVIGQLRESGADVRYVRLQDIVHPSTPETGLVGVVESITGSR
ncbi:hypothetical protein HYX08_03675 [Candidatus Woesearchaeota archaeon]|nr:hypothetical protein [Candidatus Woesearchaeota archaeon]